MHTSHPLRSFSASTLLVMLSILVPLADAHAQSSSGDGATVQARAAPQTAATAPARGVYVNTSRGIVLLYGRPPTANLRPGVGVFSVSEVTAVPSPARLLENPIAVLPPPQYVAGSAEDERIRREVERALHALDAEANQDIRVRVKRGVVWLSGDVPSWQGHAARFHATRSVAGVRAIFNRLHEVRPNDDTRR